MITGPDSVHLEIVVKGNTMTRNYYFKGELKYSEENLLGVEEEKKGMDGRVRKVWICYAKHRCTVGFLYTNFQNALRHI